MFGKCRCCGCEMELLCIFVDGKRICKECADSHCVSCERCGTLILKNEDDRVNVGGKLLCRRCVNQHYVTCSHCGELIQTDEALKDERNISLCQKCFDEYYYCCDCCGTFLRTNAGEIDLKDSPTEDGCTMLCQECYNDFYYRCDSCGKIVHYFDMELGDNGTHYCISCYDKLKNN